MMPTVDAAAEAPAEGSATFVTALARGLSVLKAFSDANHQMTLAEVAKLVNLSRATVRRCLLTLETLGYVEVEGRYFSLSPQVLTIAQAYLSSHALPRIAQPFLERISEALGQSCSVSVLSRSEVIYIARSTRRRIASLHRDVGTHLPAFCTSMGRVLLAALPERDLDIFLADTQLDPLTPFTITDPETLRQVLGKVRREGFCIVDQELEVDLRSLAVPLHNAAGRIVAAINVSTQAGRVSRRQLARTHLPALRDAAAEMRPLLIG